MSRGRNIGLALVGVGGVALIFAGRKVAQSVTGGSSVSPSGAAFVKTAITSVGPDGKIGFGVGFNGPGYPIYGEERLRGADSRILAFVAEWKRTGPFPLFIFKGGGNDRTEADVAKNLVNGTSNAKTLKDTAHGRGGAGDFYPAVVRNGTVVGMYLAEQPPKGQPQAPADMIRPDLFEIIARRGEASPFKLQAGYRWTNMYGFGKYGDAAHLQVPNWRDLPYPPLVRAVS